MSNWKSASASYVSIRNQYILFLVFFHKMESQQVQINVTGMYAGMKFAVIWLMGLFRKNVILGWYERDRVHFQRTGSFIFISF